MIIGIDVGGTHTDGVLIKKGSVHKVSKVTTRKNNLKESIFQALDQLLAGENDNEIERIVFSTTLTTNLIAQGNYPDTGLIMIPGPGLNPEWLKIATKNWVLSGYIDHRGRKVSNLDQKELTALADELENSKIKDLAIVGKFSNRNPIIEEELKSFILNSLSDQPENIQLGSQVSPVLNFPRRVQTTWLNTAVHREYKHFLYSIKKSVAERKLKSNIYLMKADGGVMPLADGFDNGIQTIKSGPAASIMGFLALTPHEKRTSILLDVGGTTTDIALMVDGVPLFEPEGVEIERYSTSVRGLLNRSISYGGDSYLSFSQDGQVQLMPQRQGPAAAFGGNSPTLTDALVITGLMKKGDVQKSYQAISYLLRDGDQKRIVCICQQVINQFYQIIGEKVSQILTQLNQQPVYTIYELLSGINLKPEVVMMIGGSADALLPGIAEALNLKPILPDYHHVANALGAAVSRATIRHSLYADTVQNYYLISGDTKKPQISHTPEKFTLEKARQILLDYTRDQALKKIHHQPISNNLVEITLEESFNVIGNFCTQGQIIRLEAQVKPGIEPILTFL